jgi:hypothetical protein
LIFSLGLRYSPKELAFVFVDLLGNFVPCPGGRRLTELPHILAAPPTLQALAIVVARLEALFESGAERPSVLFVIDDYDDFSEELSSDYALQDRLAGLVRRYSRDGLYFVIAGRTFGSAGDRLYNRIRASGVGLALRNAQALERLALADVAIQAPKTDLALGRGYLAQEGQLTPIQLAYPNPEVLAPPENAAAQQAVYGLDPWIEAICRAWPEGHGLDLAAVVPGTASLSGAEETLDPWQALVHEVESPGFSLPPAGQALDDLDAELAALEPPDAGLMDNGATQWHAVAQRLVQLLAATLMTAGDSREPDAPFSANDLVEILNGWNNFPDLMAQLRLLAPRYFEEEIDITLADVELLEQIGQKLSALLAPPGGEDA